MHTRSRWLALPALLLATVAIPASATIVMVDANSIQGENVLFNAAPQSGPTVFGLTKQTNTSVTFDGLGAILRTSGGQTGITGDLDASTPQPNDTVDLLDLSFGMTEPGFLFNDLEFNLFGGSATSVDFTVVDNEGQTFTFLNQALGNGQNRFGFQGIDGQSIASFTFSTNGGGIQSVRQIRLTPLDEGGGGIPSPIPEPQVWAMLLMGFGAVGVAVRRRRPQQRTVSA